MDPYVKELVIEFESFFKDFAVLKVESSLIEEDKYDDDTWDVFDLRMTLSVKGYVYVATYEIMHTYLKEADTSFLRTTPIWLCGLTFTRDSDDSSIEKVPTDISFDNILNESIRRSQSNSLKNIINAMMDKSNSNSSRLKNEFFNELVLTKNPTLESVHHKIQSSYESYIKTDEFKKVVNDQKEREKGYLMDNVREAISIVLSRNVSLEEIIEMAREEAVSSLMEK